MNNKLNKKLQGNKNAFTIIEVVLVLAIAGLIFLIVFLALPGLQRSRRDTQRKSDFNNIITALETYASNNGGKYKDGGGYQALTSFLPNSNLSANDPQGYPYVITTSGIVNANIVPQPTYDWPVWRIGYVPNGVCGSNNLVQAPDVTPTPPIYKYAISMVLENGTVCKQI